MFFRIGTRHFDFYFTYVRAARNCDPSIARQRNWIYRICNHRSTETQVILSDRVADAISGVIDRLAEHPRVTDRLLNRIDPNMHCLDLTGQLPCNGRLSAARQAAQDYQHSFAEILTYVRMRVKK